MKLDEIHQQLKEILDSIPMNEKVDTLLGIEFIIAQANEKMKYKHFSEVPMVPTITRLELPEGLPIAVEHCSRMLGIDMDMLFTNLVVIGASTLTKEAEDKLLSEIKGKVDFNIDPSNSPNVH